MPLTTTVIGPATASVGSLTRKAGPIGRRRVVGAQPGDRRAQAREHAAGDHLRAAHVDGRAEVERRRRPGCPGRRRSRVRGRRPASAGSRRRPPTRDTRCVPARQETASRRPPAGRPRRSVYATHRRSGENRPCVSRPRVRTTLVCECARQGRTRTGRCGCGCRRRRHAVEQQPAVARPVVDPLVAVASDHRHRRRLPRSSTARRCRRCRGAGSKTPTAGRPATTRAWRRRPRAWSDAHGLIVS